MLGDREQRVLDDLERNHDAETASPTPRPGPRLRRGRWRDGAGGRYPLRAFVAGVVAGWGGLHLLTPGAGAVAIAPAAGFGWPAAAPSELLPTSAAVWPDGDAIGDAPPPPLTASQGRR